MPARGASAGIGRVSAPRLDAAAATLTPVPLDVTEADRTAAAELAAACRETVRRTAAGRVPPEEVTRAVGQALNAARPRSRCLVGIDAEAQARLRPLVPTPLGDRLVARAIGS